MPVTFDAEGYTALYSTGGDLARFGMFHLKAPLPDQKAILTDRSLELLWQHHEPGVECTTRRLGWDVQQDFGLETVQHGGGGPGIHNWLYMIPSENLVIALMSNARYSNTYSDPVLVELIAAALSESSRGKLRQNAGRGYPQTTEIDPADFRGRWTLVLRSIKELEFDFAMGKMSKADFDDMGGRLRRRAVGLMRQLDAGSGYREQIEKELEQRLGEPAPAAAKVEHRCACGTLNDPDARFCKSCGSKL